MARRRNSTRVISRRERPTTYAEELAEARRQALKDVWRKGSRRIRPVKVGKRGSRHSTGRAAAQPQQLRLGGQRTGTRAASSKTKQLNRLQKAQKEAEARNAQLRKQRERAAAKAARERKRAAERALKDKQRAATKAARERKRAAKQKEKEEKARRRAVEKEERDAVRKAKRAEVENRKYLRSSDSESRKAMAAAEKEQRAQKRRDAWEQRMDNKAWDYLDVARRKRSRAARTDRNREARAASKGERARARKSKKEARQASSKKEARQTAPKSKTSKSGVAKYRSEDTPKPTTVDEKRQAALLEKLPKVQQAFTALQNFEHGDYRMIAGWMDSPEIIEALGLLADMPKDDRAFLYSKVKLDKTESAVMQVPAAFKRGAAGVNHGLAQAGGNIMAAVLGGLGSLFGSRTLRSAGADIDKRLQVLEEMRRYEPQLAPLEDNIANNLAEAVPGVGLAFTGLPGGVILGADMAGESIADARQRSPQSSQMMQTGAGIASGAAQAWLLGKAGKLAGGFWGKVFGGHYGDAAEAMLAGTAHLGGVAALNGAAAGTNMLLQNTASSGTPYDYAEAASSDVAKASVLQFLLGAAPGLKVSLSSLLKNPQHASGGPVSGGGEPSTRTGNTAAEARNRLQQEALVWDYMEDPYLNAADMANAPSGKYKMKPGESRKTHFNANYSERLHGAIDAVREQTPRFPTKADVKAAREFMMAHAADFAGKGEMVSSGNAMVDELVRRARAELGPAERKRLLSPDAQNAAYAESVIQPLMRRMPKAPVYADQQAGDFAMRDLRSGYDSVAQSFSVGDMRLNTPSLSLDVQNTIYRMLGDTPKKGDLKALRDSLNELKSRSDLDKNDLKTIKADLELLKASMEASAALSV